MTDIKITLAKLKQRLNSQNANSEFVRPIEQGFFHPPNLFVSQLSITHVTNSYYAHLLVCLLKIDLIDNM